MQSNHVVVFALAIVALQTSACQRRAVKDETEHPAKVEPIDGTDLHRVILTERAMDRIGLKTDLVREVELTPSRTVWGVVVRSPIARAEMGGQGWVRIRLLTDELLQLARGLPAQILREDRDDDDALTAQAAGEEDDDDEDEAGDDDEDRPARYRASAGAGGAGASPVVASHGKHAARKPVKGKRVYYAVQGDSRSLVPEQRVRVKLALSGDSSKQRVVPYSALIYDPHGQTWIYTSPQPRTFIRQKVEVDHVRGNWAILSEGPPTGTVLASVGVAELYGTEFKVGH